MADAAWDPDASNTADIPGPTPGTIYPAGSVPSSAIGVPSIPSGAIPYTGQKPVPGQAIIYQTAPSPKAWNPDTDAPLAVPEMPLVSAAPPAPVTAGGLGKAYGSGLLSSLVAPTESAATSMLGLPGFSVNMLPGLSSLTPTDALRGLGLYHAPENVPEQAASTLGEFTPGAVLGPEGDASALEQLASRVGMNVAAPTLGSLGGRYGSAAMGATPQEQEGWAAAGAFGGGVGGWAAMNPQGALATVKNAADPFAAALSPGAATNQAARAFAGMATDLPAARSALAGYEPPIPATATNPGSALTTGDVTGDLGMIGASRRAATTNPVGYGNITGQQTVARNQTLTDLKPNADPMAVQGAVKGHLDALDAAQEANVQAATQAAQQRAAQIGGQGNPADYGASIRSLVSDALKASDANEATLWQAIDPEGKLTGNVSATRQAAKTITGAMSQYDTPMNAAEQRIFGQAQSLPDVAKLSDIVALRKSINDAASTELATNGATATYARLSALRTALADNLGTTISDAPGAGAKLQAWSDGNRPSSNVATGVGGRGNQPLATGPTAVSSGSGGTALPQTGGPPGAQSVAGLQGQISPELKPIMVQGRLAGYTTPTGEMINAAVARGWQPPVAPPASAIAPTIDAAAQARMASANQATAEQAQTFRQGPVASTLKTAGYAGQYTMPSGQVPGQFFKPGPTGFEAMQALGRASPEALPAVQDYAASTLRSAAMRPDGTLDPAKFAAWQSKYADSIRALPADMQGTFADAAKASQSMADAAVAKTQAAKDATTRALSLVTNSQTPEELTARIGSILNGPTRVSDVQRLIDAIGDNPQAKAGMKQAALDYITGKFIGNTEAGATGANKISADSFQTFLKNARPALARIFEPDELNRLNAVASDITQSQRTLQATKLAGGSNTAQDIAAGGVIPHGNTGSILASILGGGIGAAVGGAVHHLGGAIIAEPIGQGLGMWAQALRSQGIAKVTDLVNRAALDPAVARVLLARANGSITPNSPQGSALLKALALPAVKATPPAQTKPASPPSALQGTAGLTGAPAAPASALQGVQ